MRRKKPQHLRKRRKETRQSMPDESLSFGPIQVARFGKIVAMQSRMTEGEHQAFVARAASCHDEICQSVTDLANKVAAIVRSTNPLHLLHRAYLEIARARFAGEPTDELPDHHLLEYLQAVIVSVLPDVPQQDDLDDKNWKELKDNILAPRKNSWVLFDI